MITSFCLVVTFYIPCLATFAGISLKLSARWAAGIGMFTIVVALIGDGKAAGR